MADKDAQADKPVNIPDTTAPVVGDDVQKIAIVQPGAHPIDQKATQETIEQDRALTESRNANNPANRLGETGLMFIDDPLARKRYVGIPPAEGDVSIHGTPAVVLIKLPLSARAPEPGLMVYPESGQAFAIQEGQRDWLSVTSPDGTPLVGEVKAEKKAA